MNEAARLSHIAFLVPSLEEAVKAPKELGLFIHPQDSFEETIEIYVGEDDFDGRLLLMAAKETGSYRKALEKRGPGLHHIAVDVLNLEKYISSLSGSGWLLHLNSLDTIQQFRGVYLARPGFPGLIEVQEKKEISKAPAFISKFEVPFNDQQMRMIEALGITEIEKSKDSSYWLTCQDKRFDASLLYSQVPVDISRFYERGTFLCIDGPAKQKGQDHSNTKVCFTCRDQKLLMDILINISTDQDCYFVKLSHYPKDGMFLGRAFFTTEDSAGKTWVKYKSHPKMMANLQDDNIASKFRRTH